MIWYVYLKGNESKDRTLEAESNGGHQGSLSVGKGRDEENRHEWKGREKETPLLEEAIHCLDESWSIMKGRKSVYLHGKRPGPRVEEADGKGTQYTFTLYSKDCLSL